MPTYEYECRACGHSFEVNQNMSDPPLSECPECGKDVRRLIFGGTGVIFKGSGFYATDSRKGTAAKPAPKAAETATPDVGSSAGTAPAGTAPAAASKPATAKSAESAPASPAGASGDAAKASA